MKICLYLEFYHSWLGRIFYRRIGTGLLSSYYNQRAVLTALNIPWCESWSDDCDILQINTPWLFSLYLIRKARKQGKKIVIWSHVTAEDTKGVFRFGAFIAPLMRKYLTYTYGLADMIFAPSTYTKHILISYGLSAEKITPLSNGVSVETFNQLARPPISRPGRIGTMALAIPRKGIDTFLVLARSFPDQEFMWFGKIYSSLLVRSLPKVLPHNVTFTGYIDNKDKCSALNSLDIFVFPSYEENEGMAILEAAAIGLPIIVRNIPVYKDWLIDGENCLMASTDGQFIECIQRLIRDAALRARLCQGARKLAQSRDLHVVGSIALSVYRKLLYTDTL